ncbi:hypothetical protein ACKGJI_09780 [Sulfurospirillum sp. 1307]|jgi:predicted transcriptional regulator
MKDYTFLPMDVDGDKVTIYEPYGSMISKKYSCEKLSGTAKYICLCMNNIEDKKAFLKDIVNSIKQIQTNMIRNAINSKAIFSL